MRALVVFVLSAMAMVAYAGEEGVFIEDKPASCLPAVEAAMLSRRWEIQSKTNSAISASIHSKGRGVKAQLTVYFKDSVFYYRGEATRKVISGEWYESEEEIVASDIPENWLQNLRSDTLVLCARSGHDQPQDNRAENRKTPQERLQTVQTLLDQGLISEEEYQQVRQDILESI